MRRAAAARAAGRLALAAVPGRSERLRQALRRRAFRRLARAWDDWHRALPGGRPDPAYAAAARRDAARFARHLPPQPVLADIGCGDARLAPVLAPRCRRYEGFDASPLAVSRARSRLRPFPNARVELLRDWRLPRPAAAYDAAILHGVLGGLELEAGLALLREAARVLRPGAVALFDAPDLFDPWNIGRLNSPRENAWPDERRPRYWSRAMLRALLPPLGFAVESIAPGRNLFVRARRLSELG